MSKTDTNDETVQLLASTQNPWESGILTPDVHTRLVADIDNVSRRAGLGERYKSLIWEPTDKGLLSPTELEWAQAVLVYSRTNIWSFDKIGICFPPSTPDITNRMRQLTAKLLRNIVDARILTVHEILSERKANDGIVEGTAIMCPDFILPEYMSTFSDWDRKELIGFLKDRAKDGKPTNLYVGVAIADLKAHGKFPSVAAELVQSFMVQGA